MVKRTGNLVPALVPPSSRTFGAESRLFCFSALETNCIHRRHKTFVGLSRRLAISRPSLLSPPGVSSTQEAIIPLGFPHAGKIGLRYEHVVICRTLTVRPQATHAIRNWKGNCVAGNGNSGEALPSGEGTFRLASLEETLASKQSDILPFL